MMSETKNDMTNPVQRLVMRDLERKDCTYENNFPANIEWRYTVVVQISEHGQSVVLYTGKMKGTQQKCFLPLDFSEKYINGLYIFDA